MEITILNQGDDNMRKGLSVYSNRHIKVVGTFIKIGEKKGYKQYALIRNIINADNGEFLADHVWIEVTSRMKQLDLVLGEKIFFVGKVGRYRKGYRGHNLGKVLSTKAPSCDYSFINVQNVIRYSDVLRDSSYLEKLRYREKYIEAMRANDSERREEVEKLIEETEAKKDKFRDNALLYVKPIRTIEVLPSNKYINFPLVYAFVDSKMLKGSFKKFSDLMRHFISTYRQARQYNQCRDEIKTINSEIIGRYREARILFRRKKKMDGLLSRLGSAISTLENKLAMTKNVVWEQTYDDSYGYGNQTQKVLKP